MLFANRHKTAEEDNVGFLCWVKEIQRKDNVADVNVSVNMVSMVASANEIQGLKDPPASF